MVSMTLDKRKKYYIYLISILIVSLLKSGTVQPVYAGAEDQLDQWYVRHDPDLGISDDYELWGIAYGNGKFIAVGDCYSPNHYDPILTSTNGADWEEQVSGVKGTVSSLSAAAFGNGIFVVTGMGGLILTSPDGEAWTVKNPYDSGEDSLMAVAYGNDTFVAAGQSGTTWTSPDGESWTKSTLSLNYSIRGIVYDNGMFVAVGESGKIWTSADGTDWTAQSSDTGNDLNSIAFGNGIFTAVGSDGTILTSTDGSLWVDHSIGSTGSALYGVAFGSGIFVAVSGNGAVLTSTDGAVWTTRNTSIPEEASGVAYGNDTFCIAGGCRIYQSEDLGSEAPVTNPNISKQPADKTVAAGQTATFTVEATGDEPLSYQWKKDGVSLSNGGKISGADGAELTIADVQDTDEGSYTCEVSNDKGNVTSDAATLTVVPEGSATTGNWSDYTSTPSLIGDTYTITSGEELAWLASEINKGNNISSYNFNMTSDIDLSLHYWTPVGVTDTYPFKSRFSGGGHTISGMNVGTESEPSPYEYAGLFGASGSSAQIEDIKITDAYVSVCSGANAGGLIGYNMGTVDNCSVTGVVEGGNEANIGGLAGYSKGSISDSTAECMVNGGDVSYVGGFAGSLAGNITNSKANCTVNGGAGSTVGGFTGDYVTVSGSISNCYAVGSVTGGGATNDFESCVGGFAGYSAYSSVISNCYSACDVTGGGSSAEWDCYVGGFIGYNRYANQVNAYWNSSAVQTVGGTVLTENKGAGGGKDTTINKTDMEMKASSFTEALNGWVASNSGHLSWISDKCNINGGYPIFITDITPPQISPAAIVYLLDDPRDVSTEIVWNSAGTVKSVEYNSGGLTADGDYVVSGNGITIKNAFLSGLNLAENDTAVFTVNFDLGDSVPLTVKARNSNSDASLEELKVGGTTVPGFAYDKYDYSYQLPYGTQAGSATANVEAASTDPNAHVGIMQAAILPGDAVVTVTAEDGKTELTYTVHLTIKSPANGGGGGGSSNSGTGVYNASVSGNGKTQNNLPVTVNTKTESAVVDLGTLSGGLFTGGEETVVRLPSIPGVNSYTMEVPSASLAGLSGEEALTLSTTLGSLNVSGGMLTGIPGAEGKGIGITIGRGDKNDLSEEAKARIGDRPLIQLTLTVGQKQTDWNNPETPVTVSVPYTPTESELANPESIVVWYIDGSGKAVSVSSGHYDPATGLVTFRTTHFSYYAVGCNPVSFSDVPESSWYNKAVRFIAAREITAGAGNGSYQPKEKLTRGAFLVMMMRAYGIEPDLEAKDNFADAGSKYYTNYLSAAKRLGISEGTGNNLFAPDKEITRQEMFTLQYNMLKKINQLPAENSGKQLADFSDAGQVASWARDASAFLTKAGIISGSGGKLSPKGTVTRAEMAQSLYNLLAE